MVLHSQPSSHRIQQGYFKRLTFKRAVQGCTDLEFNEKTYRIQQIKYSELVHRQIQGTTEACGHFCPTHKWIGALHISETSSFINAEILRLQHYASFKFK